MIFVGDIAIPYKGAIRFDGLPASFYKRSWFGNLEGAIVKTDSNHLHAVYNHKDAIDDVLSRFNFRGFGLANNHIFDTGVYADTVRFLEDRNILHVGTGPSLEGACKEILLEEDGKRIVIVNFGWEVIQCKIAGDRSEGVNPLRRRHVLETISSLSHKYLNAKIISFVHWSYELEGQPQPFERELARQMIDCGASGVIGCHPHRIGGFEMYKGRPICYSLGNWMFKQNYFHHNKLMFPDFCNEQLAFEWDFVADDFKFHFFNFNKIDSSIEFQCTEDLNSTKMQDFTQFRNYNNSEYKRWYKLNHYHKNKGLPIYYWEDSATLISIKNAINRLRDKLISVYIKIKA